MLTSFATVFKILSRQSIKRFSTLVIFKSVDCTLMTWAHEEVTFVERFSREVFAKGTKILQDSDCPICPRFYY